MGRRAHGEVTMNWNPTDEVIDRAVALDDLAPHPRNYKAHPAAQIERLAASLVAFGQPRTVAVWRGTILAGHGVTQAARHLGWRQIRASIVPDAWSAERAQAYVVADNETQRGADVDEEALAALIDEATQEVDLGALGFDQAGLDALLAGLVPVVEPGAGGDDFDATPADEGPTRCQSGDLWIIGGVHRLIIGDSTDPATVARLMGGEKPFLMVTDPPYGVEYDQEWRSSNRIGKVENDDRADWREAYKLIDADVMYCWHAGRHASNVQDGLQEAGYEIRAQIIWVKNRLVFSQGHYHWKHEPCWYGVREGATAQWAGDRTQTTTWEFGIDPDVDGGHSTQKPLECMARPMRNHGKPGDLVVDPFLGSGTTLIAAHRTGRRCYGVEIAPRYGDVILRRAEAEGLTVEVA